MKGSEQRNDNRRQETACDTGYYKSWEVQGGLVSVDTTEGEKVIGENVKHEVAESECICSQIKISAMPR